MQLQKHVIKKLNRLQILWNKNKASLSCRRQKQRKFFVQDYLQVSVRKDPGYPPRQAEIYVACYEVSTLCQLPVSCLISHPSRSSGSSGGRRGQRAGNSDVPAKGLLILPQDNGQPI